jgi:type 1 glutamine amidotransferase
MRLALIALAALLIAPMGANADDPPRPIKLLIITGDNVSVHDWKATTQALRDTLSAQGRVNVEVTSTPADDLTDENLAKYDVLLLNYRDTDQGGPKTKWSEANKAAFLKAIKGGKGLVVLHYASGSFVKPNWDEFEKAVAGGWRTQGYHGPAHEFTVKKTDARHPISEGLPSEFKHAKDELYSNSMMIPGSVVLATAYADPKLPKGTGKDEAIVWVNTYGKGRVVENVLGHDVETINDPGVQPWLKRSVEWAATGKVAPGH